MESGKVTFQKTDVIKGTVNGIYGWWHVVGSKVIFDTTVAKNSNGWWYIRGGKVDFGYNGNVWYHGHNYWVSDGWIRM